VDSFFVINQLGKLLNQLTALRRSSFEKEAIEEDSYYHQEKCLSVWGKGCWLLFFFVVVVSCCLLVLLLAIIIVAVVGCSFGSSLFVGVVQIE